MSVVPSIDTGVYVPCMYLAHHQLERFNYHYYYIVQVTQQANTTEAQGSSCCNQKARC